MTRIEELTLQMVDGQLSRSEREELMHLVNSDGDARRAHLALLTIEATLRRHGRVEISDQVMRRIDEERTSQIVRGVMGPVSEREPTSGRVRRAGAIALLLTASLAAAIGGVRSWARANRTVRAADLVPPRR
jgi:hypothetical protein